MKGAESGRAGNGSPENSGQENAYNPWGDLSRTLSVSRMLSARKWSFVDGTSDKDCVLEAQGKHNKESSEASENNPKQNVDPESQKNEGGVHAAPENTDGKNRQNVNGTVVENNDADNGNNGVENDNVDVGMDVDGIGDDLPTLDKEKSEPVPNQEDLEKTRNWNSINRYEQVSALNPENLEKRGIVANLMNKIKRSGIGKRVALVAIAAVLVGGAFFGYKAIKGNTSTKDTYATESNQESEPVDLQQEAKNALDETKAEKNDYMGEINFTNGEKIDMNLKLGGDNTGNDFMNFAGKEEGRSASLTDKDARLMNERALYEAAKNDPAKMQELTRLSYENIYNKLGNLGPLTQEMGRYGLFDGSLADMDAIATYLQGDSDFYAKSLEDVQARHLEDEKHMKHNLILQQGNYASFYANTISQMDGVANLKFGFDHSVAPKNGGILIDQMLTEDGENWFEAHLDEKINVLKCANIIPKGASDEEILEIADKWIIIGREIGCGQLALELKTPPTKKTKENPPVYKIVIPPTNKEKVDPPVYEIVQPPANKEKDDPPIYEYKGPIPPTNVEIIPPTNEEKDNPPVYKIVVPPTETRENPPENKEIPPTEPKENPPKDNEIPPTEPKENPPEQILQPKTDYVGVDRELNSVEESKTNTDQSLPVAEYTNPDNNAMNNNPESVEKNISAVQEQAADFTDKDRMDNEAVNDRGAEDSEGAKQHFEEEKQTNNDETADADSNGMEDLSVSDWGFEE